MADPRLRLALFAAWLCSGTALAAFGAWAWLDREGLKALERLLPGRDAFLHVGAGLLLLAFCASGLRLFLPRTGPWFAVGLALAAACSDEAAQMIQGSGRKASWADLACSAAGIALGALILLAWSRLRGGGRPQRGSGQRPAPRRP